MYVIAYIGAISVVGISKLSYSHMFLTQYAYSQCTSISSIGTILIPHL